MSLIGAKVVALFAMFAVAASGDGGSDVRAGSGFDRAIASVMPRVVKLYGLRGGMEPGYGTGVIVSDDGLVLTVDSLLIDARQIRCVTSNGELYHAEIVHRDSERQLALLQLSAITDQAMPHTETQGTETRTTDEPRGLTGFPFFDLSSEATLRPGDWVVAAGNSFKVAEGAEPVSLVHGTFSARTRLDARRRLKDFPYRGDVLVIDAITSNPGAPGSALVNLDGRFVGMIGREVVANLTHTHLNYAVPRDVLYAYLHKVTTGPDEDSTAPHSDVVVRRDVLQGTEAAGEGGQIDHGIRLSRVGYRKKLPFVDRVRKGSPAELAGVREDDLILSVNGRSVPDVAAFDTRLRTLAPNEPINLVIRRGQTIVSVRVETREEPGAREVDTPKEDR